MIISNIRFMKNRFSDRRIFRFRCLSDSLWSRTPPPPPSGRNPIVEIFSPTPQPKKEITNPLLREIIEEIKFSGSIPVSRYMRLCLTHPKYGFYMNQDVFGTKGHFITSPEISQIFGEMISIWIMYNWQQFANGKPLDIIELGPGRGTLSSDISRTMAQFSESNKHDCRFHLVEISPHLRMIQKKNLCKPEAISDDSKSETKYGQQISWYESLQQIPMESERFPVFVANEFFDAFPIHKFALNPEKKWRELLIDYNEELQRLTWIQARDETPVSKLIANRKVNGHHLEYCPQMLAQIEKIIQRLNDLKSGCMLICDYGYDDVGTNNEPINRDTFRAYKNHEQCDPLEDPGMADLTADVDFGCIRESFSKKASIYGTITQRHFLEQMGIGFRLKKLLQITDKKQSEELVSGVRMLMEDMGERFRFMAILNQNHPENQKPVGF